MAEEKTISTERQEILKKIEEYEKMGNFDTDVENDPPSSPLLPDDIDYLKKKLKNRIKTAIVNRIADKQINNLINANQIIIKEIRGAENLKEIKGPAFVTSNHFHPFENMALYKAFQLHQPNKHKFYRVIREGNYTAPPKGFDMFFKHANTLPLSSNSETMRKFMKALEVLTKKNNYILVYPEQYMWWNYKKPRPYKDGVYRFSAKFNVPIIPCFITMSDSEFLDGDNLPIQEYTIHIMKPIYPDKNLTLKENTKTMKDKNFELCKDVYEKAYNKKLTYTYEEKN